MKKLTVLFSFCFLLFSFNAFAQEEEKSFQTRFLLEGGIEFGGDEILEVFFTNGGDQKMKAGQGGYLAVGGEFQFAKVKPLLFRTTLGIKYNTTAAENANIRFTRIPINIVGYWKIMDDVRIGIGVSAHQNVQFKGDGFVDDKDFTSNVGPRFEIGYKWFAVTYTALKYTADTDGKVDASSIGLSVSYAFSKK